MSTATATAQAGAFALATNQSAPSFTHDATSPFFVPRARRMAPLERLGRRYDASMSIEQNLVAAGMDEPVRLLPAPIQLPDGRTVPTKNKHIVITSPGRGGNEPKLTSLGVVAGKWKPLQMPQFIEHFEFLFDKYPPHSLINVGGGRKQGLLLRPEQMPKATVLNEDMEVGYMLLNDYSGKGSISIQPIVQRLVCTNGMVAMHAGQLSVLRLAHTDRGLIELDRQKQLMRDLTLEPSEVIKSYEVLARKQVSKEQVRAVVEQVHTMPKRPVQLIRPGKYSPEEVLKANESFESTMARIRQQREVVMALNQYENDTAASHLRGTAWLSWQAIVEESNYNHHGGQPSNSTGMFLGGAATEQTKGFKLLLEA